jgi:Tfp pilus assembly protein PilP
MHFVKTLVLGITVASVVPCLHAQAKPVNGAGSSAATAAAAKTTSQAAKPATAQAPGKPAAATASAAQNKPASSTSKPAAAASKPAASASGAKPKQAAKPAAKPAPKQAKKSTPKPAKPATGSATAEKEPKVAKRDPFESLVGREHGGGPTGPLPAGKAGLQVGTLRLDGIVRAPNGMIAVVSNPQSRTYFLREGDQLYDGRVEKIAMDGVSFHEVGKDAFGKPVEREVSKRIYASAGEQQ